MRIVQFLLGIASVFIIIAGLKVSSDLVGPLLLAFTLTFLFTPLLQWLKKIGLPSGLAILVMSFGVLSVIGLFIFLIYLSTVQLVDELPTYQKRLETQLVPIQQSLQQLAKQWNIPTETTVPKELQNGSAVIKAVFSFLSNVVEGGTSLGFFLFTLLLMLIASDGVSRKFRKRFTSGNHFFIKFTTWSSQIQKQYFIQTMSNLLSAIVITVTFLLLRIDFAFLWGMLAFLLAYIPNIGLILASIPPVLLAFIQHGPQTALITVGVIILLNVVMDNVVTPRFMGKGLEVPAAVVFLSFLFWTYVFGVIGAFLALPITLALRSLLQENKKTKFFADILSN